VIPALQFGSVEVARKHAGRRIPMSAFVERYIDGSIDVDGDLQRFLRGCDGIINYRLTMDQLKFIALKFIPSLLVHSKSVDKKFVTEHYDRGNDFFEAFLGETMVYTSAFFKGRDERLETAQRRKIRYVGEKLQLEKGERLLDIGCGWGTLVADLVDQFGVDGTGVTLSSKQTEFAMDRIRARGLGDRARILTQDYRDIGNAPFDKISCLEMAEHVGVKNFQKFLRQVSGMLSDDGLFFLQIVGLRRPPEGMLFRNDRGGYWNARDFSWTMFMSRYIFPGADASLPLSFVATQLEKAGFEIRTVENINVHYGLTIHRWYENWKANREKVIAAYGEWWYRLWHLFLAWSSINGEQGRGDCFQIVAHKSRREFDRSRWMRPQPALGEFSVDDEPAVPRRIGS
jgi:cyclopropane fatty-acyl-phospholipid synthase-like methyltransferase